MAMIRYEDILSKIKKFEADKSRIEQQLDSYHVKHEDVKSKLKLLYEKKKLFEDMEEQLSGIISKPKKIENISVSTDVASTE